MLPAPRSTCPINQGVEMLGDLWRLVILRDIIFCGYSEEARFQFRQFRWVRPR